MAGGHAQEVASRYGKLELSRFIGELIRTLMSALMDDVLAETGRRLAKQAPRTAAEIRSAKGAMAGFSPARENEVRALKQYLYSHMYRHARVMGPMEKAKRLVIELFEALASDPGRLPPDWKAQCGAGGDAVTRGVVRDYIAGMTDNYALHEHQRVMGKPARL